MRAHLRGAAQLAALLFLGAIAGCSGGGRAPAPILPAPLPAGPRASASIALTAHDQRLLVVNPDDDTLAVFSVALEQPVQLCALAVGNDPRAVAVTGRGHKAYVTNAGAGTVSVVDLGGDPRVAGTVSVGTEPRAVLVDDADARAYVANAGSGTISVIDVATDRVVATLTLDPAVGSSPRALAWRRDGGSERLYAACFFAELRPGRTGLDESQDDAREGRVAVFDTASLSFVGSVALAPMLDTGFRSNGSVLDRIGTENGAGGTDAPDPTNPPTVTFATGAFPNQLAAIAIHPRNGKAYVVSTAASPNGPFGFNVNAQGLVSVIDLTSNVEVTGDATGVVHRKAPLNLNQGVKQGTAAGPVLFHTNPVAMAFGPDGSEAWVAIQNSDVIVRLTVDDAGLPSIDAPVQAGAAAIARVDLQEVGAGGIPGKAPRGLVIDAAGKRAFVHNYTSRSISVVDLAQRKVVASALTSPLPGRGTPDEQTLLGAELFFSGRGPQGRMSSESWGACAVCHPDGLADSVTWQFPAGPRQTIPLDGMFNRFHAGDQRILNWSALRDENQDFELNTRNVFGGRGLIEDDRAIFVVGGGSGAGPDDSPAILQYHQFLNAVGTSNALAEDAALPALLGARRDFGMATLADGRVVIAGGRSGAAQGALLADADAVLLFEPASNRVTRRSSRGFTGRHSFGLVAVETPAGPRVLAIGGYASTAVDARPVTTVEEYDIATDTWRAVAPLPVGVAQAGVAANGPLNVGEPLAEVNVLCGNRGSERLPQLTGAILRYRPDPTGPGVWRTLAFEFTPRRDLGAAAIVRGVFPSHVFAIGGRDAQGNALTTVEAFAATTSQAQPTDPVGGVAVLTPLPQARHSFAIATASNRIFVFGGVDAAGADADAVFEYNAAANPAGAAGAPGTPAGTWTGKAPLPAARRGARASSPTPVANFLVSRSAGRDARQDAIAAWVARNVRSARAPRAADDAAAVAGRVLFETQGLTGVQSVSCASCHGGAKWTRSTVDFASPPSPDLGRGNEEVRGAELRRTRTQPSVLADVGTFAPFTAGRNIEGRFNPADVGQRINALGGNGFNSPSLLSVHATAPYFHHGAARSLDDVLNGTVDGQGGSPLRSVHHVVDPARRAELVAYLQSIDATTPVVR